MEGRTKITWDTDLTAEDYFVVGVASCYYMEDGELRPIQVLEPIPSAYLESIFQGVPTSYQYVYGTTLGAVVTEGGIAEMTGLEPVQLCQNFGDRATAAVRTYKARPSAKEWVALGETRHDINYSTEKKRVLNRENVVTPEDNVRQHKYTHEKL